MYVWISRFGQKLNAWNILRFIFTLNKLFLGIRKLPLFSCNATLGTFLTVYVMFLWKTFLWGHLNTFPVSFFSLPHRKANLNKSPHNIHSNITFPFTDASSRPLLYTSYIYGLRGAAQQWWRMTFVINALTINCHIITEPASWSRSETLSPSSCLVHVKSALSLEHGCRVGRGGQSSLWRELKWVT